MAAARAAATMATFLHLPPKAPGGLKPDENQPVGIPGAHCLHLPPKAPGGLKRLGLGVGVAGREKLLALAPEGARGIETRSRQRAG